MQEQLTLPEIVCARNNPAFMACKNSKCETSGLICFDQACDCKKTHSKCALVQISGIVQGLGKAKKSLPKGTSQTFSAIEAIVQELYQEVSNLRDSYRLAKSVYGAGKNSSKLLGYIYSKQFQRITGKLIERVEHEQEGKIDQLVSLPQNAVSVQQNWENSKPDFERIIRQIQSYFQFSTIKKPQNTASTPISKNTSNHPKTQSVQKKQQHSQSRNSKQQVRKQTKNQSRKKEQHNGQSNGRPKKPLSAYFVFLNKTRKNISEAYPDIKGQQINGLFTQIWNGLDSSEKGVYQEQARRLRVQYEKELFRYWKEHPEEMTKGEKKRLRQMQKPENSRKAQNSDQQQNEQKKKAVNEKLALIKENLKISTKNEKKKVKIVQSDEQQADSN